MLKYLYKSSPEPYWKSCQGYNLRVSSPLLMHRHSLWVLTSITSNNLFQGHVIPFTTCSQVFWKHSVTAKVALQHFWKTDSNYSITYSVLQENTSYTESKGQYYTVRLEQGQKTSVRILGPVFSMLDNVAFPQSHQKGYTGLERGEETLCH